MIRRHPTSDKLRQWLHAESEAELPELTQHIDNCDRCAAKLEQLAEGDDASGIASALLNLLAPYDGMSDRVEGKVIDRLSSRQLATVIGDLFGAGFETSKLLLTEEDL